MSKSIISAFISVLALFSFIPVAMAESEAIEAHEEDSAAMRRAGRLPAPVSASIGVGSSCGSIISGQVSNWPESGFLFEFDDFATVASNLQAWWSVASLNPHRGWFYGITDDNFVAHAAGIQDVSEVADASQWQYDVNSAGPVPEGEIVLFHNMITGFYGAFRVDDIRGETIREAELDVTWYLQENGTGDFSTWGTCVFADDFESGGLGAWSASNGIVAGN